MKKLITLSCFLSGVLVFFAIAATQSSCQKDTNCTADVLVVDTTGTHGVQVPVVGAIVKLYANITPPGQVQAIATTDNSGNAHFTFKLPAIFDILATATVTVSSVPTPMTGSGLIQLSIGGNVSQTVIIH